MGDDEGHVVDYGALQPRGYNKQSRIYAFPLAFILFHKPCERRKQKGVVPSSSPSLPCRSFPSTISEPNRPQPITHLPVPPHNLNPLPPPRLALLLFPLLPFPLFTPLFNLPHRNILLFPPAILPVGARVSGARGRRGKGDERDDDGRPVEDEARPALLLRGRGLGGGGGDKGGEERREGFGGLRRGSAGRGGIGDASHFRAGFLAGSEERRGSLFVCGGRGRGREVLEKRSGLKWNEVKRTKGTAPQGSRETSREILIIRGSCGPSSPHELAMSERQGVVRRVTKAFFRKNSTSRWQKGKERCGGEGGE